VAGWCRRVGSENWYERDWEEEEEVVFAQEAGRCSVGLARLRQGERQGELRADGRAIASRRGCFGP
jgi:hypothetical protein